MGDLTGRLGAGEGEHLGDGIGGVGQLAGRTGLVVQAALDAFFGVASLPAPDGRPADAGLVGDIQDGEALGREQDDAGALDGLKGRARSVTMADRRAKSAALGITQTV
jgi:hypothetical protein